MEVTREEAAAWLQSPIPAPEWVDEALRAVVALYDRLASSEDQWRVEMRAREIFAAMNDAQRECIDRLRDGWVPFFRLAGQSTPRWHSPGRGGKTEPMTPEQQAVMAR